MAAKTHAVPGYRFFSLISSQDEAHFFALMGRFFANPSVRRDCGGYPLSDGPGFKWFVVQHLNAPDILGFISIEERPSHIHIREGYIKPAFRGNGLFRGLLKQVLTYIAHTQLPTKICIRSTSAPYFQAHGFQICRARGQWITLEKPPHVEPTLSPSSRSAQSS